MALSKTSSVAVYVLAIFVAAVTMYRVEVPLHPKHMQAVVRGGHDLESKDAITSSHAPEIALPEVCHGAANMEFWGDVIKWGANFRTDSAEECCNACLQNAKDGAASGKKTCNTWTYCPDIHASGVDCPWTSGAVFTPPDPALLKSGGILRIDTPLGPIKIQLRKDISPQIVKEVTQLAREQLCDNCNFYRSEAVWTVPYGPPYALIQGTLRNNGRREDGTKLLNDMKREGTPIVQRGHACLIGSGPDFFISLAAHPEWGSGHSVFGEVANMSVLDAIEKMPIKHETWGTTQVTPLVEPIPFTLAFEEP